MKLYKVLNAGVPIIVAHYFVKNNYLYLNKKIMFSPEECGLCGCLLSVPDTNTLRPKRIEKRQITTQRPDVGKFVLADEGLNAAI